MLVSLHGTPRGLSPSRVTIAKVWAAPVAFRFWWVPAFIMLCVGAVAVVVLLIWAMAGFVSLRSIGLSGNVLAALVMGIALTAGLGGGLMALVFLSDRSHQDDIVYYASAAGQADVTPRPADLPPPASPAS